MPCLHPENIFSPQSLTTINTPATIICVLLFFHVGRTLLQGATKGPLQAKLTQLAGWITFRVKRSINRIFKSYVCCLQLHRLRVSAGPEVGCLVRLSLVTSPSQRVTRLAAKKKRDSEETSMTPCSTRKKLRSSSANASASKTRDPTPAKMSPPRPALTPLPVNSYSSPNSHCSPTKTTQTPTSKTLKSPGMDSSAQKARRETGVLRQLRCAQKYTGSALY